MKLNITKRKLTVGTIFLFLLGIFLIWGLKDNIDPFWGELDQWMVADFQTLDKSIPELQTMYENFQHHPVENDSLAFQLVASPFLPAIEFDKFKSYFRLVTQKKMLLLSSVSGSGTTTITTRLAKLIATYPEKNVLNILCAPAFDLEYHKRYIGETIDGQFKQGILLDFFDRCHTHPDEKFVLLIDHFDKINPETFFGPALWEKLDNPDVKVIMGSKTIEVPNNFYMIAIIHAGASAKVELTNEHFKRLGGQPHFLEPEFKELIIYLRKRLKDKKQELASHPSERLREEVEYLSDTTHLKKLLYFFKKANQLIKNNYSKGHTLGQWSNIRKLYAAKDFDKLDDIFISHVNALKPHTIIRKKDFEPILYAIEHEGSLKGTNFINTQLKVMEEKGFLTEFVVGLSFLLITGLFSLFFFKRRQNYLRSYTTKVYDLMDAYEGKEMNYETVSMQIHSIKKEVDTLVMNNDLNYQEATFFYTFIQDKISRIEVTKSVNENFLQLMDMFLDDGVLSKKEYKKLERFLNSIKSKITEEDYLRFKSEMDKMYRLYRK